MSEVVTSDKAKALSRTWLLRALAFLALHVFLYFQLRGAYADFSPLTTIAFGWCLAESSEWRGYAKGWDANSRERERCG